MYLYNSAAFPVLQDGMLTFLLVNGIRLNCTNEDVVEAGLGVASGAMGYEELLRWIRIHRES